MDINIEDQDGLDALAHARKRDLKEIVAKLEKARNIRKGFDSSFLQKSDDHDGHDDSDDSDDKGQDEHVNVNIKARSSHSMISEEL